MASVDESSLKNDSEVKDFSFALAQFACGLSLDELPAAALSAAKTNVLDTLSCAVAGSTALGIGALREIAVEWGGAPQATIIGFGDKVPAHHAAWVNGAMAHARDYDDTHDAAVLHAGVCVVPAALAAAEWKFGVHGADFLAAVAAGLETTCRLGVATRIGITESGFMYTPLFGHFGATIAAGKLLGLDVEEMVNAIGIVYSLVSGNHQVTRDGALTKRMQPGFAAQNALMAVQLAQRGVRGVQETFDGADGFLRVYLHDACDRKALRDGLGTRFEFTNLSYKPYPCCRFNHAAIEATTRLRDLHDIGVGNIKRVRVGLTRQAYEAVCTPIETRRNPKTLVHAQFSIPYTVATAFVDGTVGLGHFTDDAIRRQEVLDLAARVEPYVDEDIERQYGRGVSPAAVRVEMIDGAAHELRVDVPFGHPERAMSGAAFEAKLTDCYRATGLPFQKDSPRELTTLVAGLEEVSDVRDLLRPLCFANAA